MWTLLMLALCSSLKEALPSPTTCRPDEQYYKCIPICHGTCSAYLTKSYLFCKMACRSGCFCREGLYKTDDGRCVPASQCSAPNSPESYPPIQCFPPKCAPGCSIDYSSRPCPSCSCSDICGANAEYRECGSACPPTCADRGKNKVCTLQCVSGCFCKKGFVKNDLEVCVRPQDCEQNTCGENEEYLRCGSACPTTCANLGKNVICTTQCVPGCYCTKGLVRNDQGKCVPPKECPQKKCPKNEVYSDCVIPCNDCKIRGKCNFLVCNKGCDCRKGYYRDFNGRCILARQCPQIDQKCPKNEVYSDCVIPCNDCKIRGKCNFLVCNKGCDCRKGYYRDFNGRCILARQCPQIDQKCPKNEVYSDCVIPCNDCQTRGKCNFLVCNKGCDCRKGYYRDFNGRCILARQCPQIDPTPPSSRCEADEQYYECIPSCDRTCKAYRRKEEILCDQICISGCFCRDGLYLADDGKTCVPPEQCDKTPSSPSKRCPKNEVYSDCVIPCNDCQTRGKCNFLVCNKGCDCRKGYYRDFNGRCILARQCPQIDPTPQSSTCEADEQYYECIPSCDRTCKAYRRKEEIFCNQICISGCFCRDGLYLADDGKTCVPPEQCDKSPSSPSKKCPKNEVHSDCVIPCNDCQTRGNCNFLVCNKGCDCKKGYYRDFSGRCIRAKQCPIIEPTPAPYECSPDQQFYECIPRCSRTCEAYTRPLEIFCGLLCIEGCFCKEGLYEAEDGSCVPPEQCPAPLTPPEVPSAPLSVLGSPRERLEQCPENEEYSDCVNPCNDCQTKGDCDFLVCNPGCDCKEGYYRDFDGSDGKCILDLQCPMIDPTPPPNQCGADEQFYDCIPACQQTCFALTSEVKIACKMPCRSGCYCKEGLYQKDDGTCVPPEGCYDDNTPVTATLLAKPMNQKCGPNEQYYRCIPTCKNTCENYQAVNPICPLICIKGCSCKKGFVKRSDGKCVKPEKCNKSPPSTKPTKPVNQQCGTNEQYYSCIPTCKNTCENYQAVNPICPRICIKGCSCKKGFVKRSDGKCVKPEKCNKSPPSTKPTKPVNQQCGTNEQYYSCIPTCKNTCENYQAVNPICPRICIKGCSCKKGFVKRSDGKCVKPEKCIKSPPSTKPTTKPTPTCRKNEEYYRCKPTCKNTCENYQAVRPICSRICIQGCACKKGFVRRSDGKCVKPEKCNKSSPTSKPTKTSPPKCGKDEQYYKCVPNCNESCDSYNLVLPCPYYCKPGCFCKEGLVKNRDGKCVKPSECPSTNPTSTVSPPIQCTIPMCGDGCSLDYSNNPCPSCSCTSVSPPTNSVCMQPKDSGPCFAIFPRFFYNQQTGQCEEFTFGGCKGNKNNFEKKEDCEKTCGTDGSEECGEDEVYYDDCAPKCTGTCEAYNNSRIYDCPLCKPGCWCSQGLVKRSDGQCVAPDQCYVKSSTDVTPTLAVSPDSCREDEEYLSCGSACPVTCRSLRKPEFSCSAVCVPGCFCKEGRVRNDEGDCVNSEDCPQNICGADEEYLDCGSACPASCSNLGQDQVCTDQCVAGCFCKDGLVRNEYGECVETEDCPQNKCGKDEEYTDCGTACPPTCSNIGTDQVCTDQCVRGCFCREGLVRNDKDICVEPEECPQNKCGKDEEYTDCGTDCPPTCSNIGKDQVCSDQCVRGCFCREGLVRNDKRECVEPEECPQISPKQCGEDEKYYDCAPSCGGTCDTYNKTAVILCLPCSPGCWCNEGLVKNDDGKCVRPEQCDVPTASPPSSNPVCQQPKKVGPCKAFNPRFFYNQETRQCEQFNYGGCRGNENNFQTKEECESKCGSATPTPTCGPDDQYYECIPNCRNTCANYNKTEIACPYICEPGCFCKEGLVKNDDGTCVSPSQCNALQPTGPPDQCGDNEEYYEDCAPSCGGTCETYKKLPIINCRVCRPGCWCIKGLVKRKDGKCVPKDQCDTPTGLTPSPPKCGKDEEYYGCVPNCHNTCETYNQKGPCPLYCKSGCFCKKGMVENKDGKCVKPSKCPSSNPPSTEPPNQCGKNEEYYEDCAPSCGGTCETYKKLPLLKCIPCRPGCWCIKGLVKRKDGKCVPKDQCDTPTASPPSSNPVCQQPKKVGPCKALLPRYFYNQETRQCEQFNYGGCRGNENNFKTKGECESKCGSE